MKVDKKVPLRMCLACKTMTPKKDLIRVVMTKEGEISLDFTGKANGRGAYICASRGCVERLVKYKLLHKAFSTNVANEVYQRLLDEYDKQ